MIEINLNFELKTLDEATVIGIAGKVLGQHMVLGIKGDPGTLYGWAKAFFNGDKIILTEEAFQSLRAWISTYEGLPILVRGQIVLYLDTAKAESVVKANS